MSYKDIAKIIPSIQAIGLVKTNLNAVKKKQSTKKMLGLATTNIVGTNMIKINADLIAGL